MFEVNLGKYLYQVDFMHCRESDATFFLGHEGTYCQILSSVGITVSTGETVLHANDNYDKNFGRKLALRRALRRAGFTRDQRILFWNEYFRTRNQKEEQEWII